MASVDQADVMFYRIVFLALLVVSPSAWAIWDSFAFETSGAALAACNVYEGHNGCYAGSAGSSYCNGGTKPPNTSNTVYIAPSNYVANRCFAYYAAQVCPAGQSPTATGRCITSCVVGTTVMEGESCVAACQYDTTISASNPQCLPPPTCAVDQTAQGQDCVPDTPQPVVGSQAPEAGIEVGTADAAGNITYNAVGENLRTGGSETYNCGGWECTVDASGFAAPDSGGSGCTVPVEGGGTVICGFRPTYTGNEAQVSYSSSVAPSGGSNVQAPTAGCPAGYSNVNGVCIAPATPGTASTTTTPGTASTPGAQTCPTGYTPDANGVCTGQAAATIQSGGEVVCPAGYSIGANGVCTATATLGGDGPPEAGGCGSPGQPACPTGDSSAQIADIASGFDASKSTWFSWVWTPPVGTCSAYAGTVHGYAISWDLCPTIANIRDVLGWLFAMLGAITVYGQIFRGHAS